MNPKRKKIISIILIFLLGSVSAPIIISAVSIAAGRSGCVQLSPSSYAGFKGGAVICGYFICNKTDQESSSKESALANLSGESSIAFIAVNNIAAIYYDAEKQSSAPSASQGNKDNWNAGLKDYIGEYKINAAGNNGFLFIYVRGGNVYGTVRFPSWGKGAVEQLKNLRITNGNISFTRSASSKAELDKLGITVPFEQQYTGSYIHSGKSIKGTYAVQGVKKHWTAYK